MNLFDLNFRVAEILGAPGHYLADGALPTTQFVATSRLLTQRYERALEEWVILSRHGCLDGDL